jgi:cytochrome c biogenesis protein CcmG/thiol:disulfide interchange protein DsbE
MRRFSSLPPVAWIAIFAVLFLGIIIVTNKPSSAVFEGYEATAGPTYSVTTLDGKTVTNESLKGKVVLINVWASWCGPCQAEFPDLIELQEKYGDKGFTIVGLAWNDEESKVRAMVKDRKLNYPIAMAGPEMGEALGGLQSIPVSILIDQDGKTRYGAIGFDPKDRPKDKYGRMIRHLLKIKE